MIDTFRFWRTPCTRKKCEQLLAAHYRPIYAYLWRLCGNTDDAEDLTQETFAKVWKALRERPWPVSIRAWIYCIARNTWLDSCRRGGRMQARPDFWWENLPAPEDHATAIEEREIATILAQKVQELDDDKREAVILRYYQGLTLRETAKVLGIAASTVKYRVHEAIMILRDQMNGNDSCFNSKADPVKKEIRRHGDE